MYVKPGQVHVEHPRGREPRLLRDRLVGQPLLAQAHDLSSTFLTRCRRELSHVYGFHGIETMRMMQNNQDIACLVNKY